VGGAQMITACGSGFSLTLGCWMSARCSA